MKRYTLNAKGRERPTVLANVIAHIQSLPETKSWRIEIREAKKERTDAQNRALFGVAYPALSEATGYTPDELHEAFCRKFFGTVGVTIMGQIVTRPRRTTTTNENGERDVLPRMEFSAFYAMVQQVGAEAGVYVPDPEP